MGKAGEETRQHRIEVVGHLLDPRCGKHDGNYLSVDLDRVVRVIGLDERSRTSNRDSVEDVKQEFGRKVVRVHRHGIGEVIPQGANTRVGERRVVLDEVGEQVIKVPKSVIDRRRGKKDQILWRDARQKAP